MEPEKKCSWWGIFSVLITSFAHAAPPCNVPLLPDGNDSCGIFKPIQHTCDSGGSGIPTSPFSDRVTGTDDVAKFNDIINKKLACCLNAFNPVAHDPTDTYSKFDCIENVKDPRGDFNELWASGDANSDGGQINALMLTNGLGKQVTGFYTLSGAHCDQYSEFMAVSDIKAYRIDPVMLSSQQTKAQNGLEEIPGILIKIPSAKGFAETRLRLQAKKKFLSPLDPTISKSEVARCPVLVRAAMVAACGSNGASPVMIKAVTDNSSGTPKQRCSAAESIQIHIRIEQLYEVTGTAKMQTIDTVRDRTQMNAISIEKIIAEKTGARCPPGGHVLGPICVYD